MYYMNKIEHSSIKRNLKAHTELSPNRTMDSNVN
jgi:hypothetical protein